MIQDLVFDVIVLGSGGGGCAAAIIAARNGASVALVSKEAIGVGNTRMSEATMASSGILDGDSPEVLKKDILKGGEYLNRLELVDLVSQNASSAVHFLESLGHFFLRDDEGVLSGTQANRLGGHSFARSFYSAGSGVSVAHALRNVVAASESISVFEDTFAASLLMEEDEVRGALAVDLKSSDYFVLRGKAVILATGGCGWLYYPHTTNVRTITGDGYAIACEAGAELVDMEMVQFFPFAMNRPPRFAGSLLGEPNLAGPKGKLINGLGEVVKDRDINRMTRAQVTALMAKEINAGRVTEWGGLKLDLSENLNVPEMAEYKKVQDSRGRWEKVRQAYGEAAFQWKEPWDVSPSAHYMMGGVKINAQGLSNLKNLYAAGETAGGSMGANRLGSSSIADIFVTGMAAGEEAARAATGSSDKEISKAAVTHEVEKIERLFGKKGAKRPITIKRELQKLMVENVGIARDEKRLTHALSEIDRMKEEAEHDISVSPVRRYNTELLDVLEVKNMLSCAEMIATCARIRTESRGAHLRLDYPEKDDVNWLKNIAIWKDNDQLKTTLSEITAREIYEDMQSGEHRKG
jgi:fumarate reductase (CoM/CoB) subunit A